MHLCGCQVPEAVEEAGGARGDVDDVVSQLVVILVLYTMGPCFEAQ